MKGMPLGAFLVSRSPSHSTFPLPIRCLSGVKFPFPLVFSIRCLCGVRFNIALENIHKTQFIALVYLNFNDYEKGNPIKRSRNFYRNIKRDIRKASKGFPNERDPTFTVSTQVKYRIF